jgi:hypothetical protein
MPEDKITLFDVIFDMVPELNKVSQVDAVPPPDTPVILP